MYVNHPPKFRRSGLGLAISVILACSTPSWAQTSSDSAREVVEGPIGQRIDTYLTRMVTFGFAGAVLIERDGQVILAKGYGSAFDALGYPNTSETVFSLESSSKQFTAAAIMKLQMQGRLNLSDTLDDFFDNVPADKQNITIHQLLSHTSGLISGSISVLQDRSKAGLLREVLNAPLLSEPGSQYAYSNYAFAIAAAIVENVSGMEFDAFQRQELFERAGMKSTGGRFINPSNLCFAHRYVNEGDRGTQLDSPHPNWNHIGAGGVLSTVWDMRAWGQALVAHEVLSSDALSIMLTPVKNSYGYGWRIEETEGGTLVKHNGGSSEGSASVVRFNMTNGDKMVAFSNRDGERILFGEGLSNKISDMMYGAEPPLPPQGRRAADASQLQDVVGEFRSAKDDAAVSVAIQSGMLFITFSGQPAVSPALDLVDEAAEVFRRATMRSQRIIDDLDGQYAAEVIRDELLTDIKTRVERGAQALGAFQGFTVLGTVPDWVWGGSDCMTIVQMRFLNATDSFRFHWKDDDFIALGGSAVGEGAQLWFIPAGSGSDDEYVGFHPATGASPRMKFQRDRATGRVVGLSIGDGDEFTAHRQ